MDNPRRAESIRHRRSVTADAVYAPATQHDLERWKGKLKGRIVLAMPIREVKASFNPLAKRYTDDELKKLEDMNPPGGQRRPYDRSQLTFGVALQFLADEGVLASFEPSRGGDGGTISCSRAGRRPTAPQTFIRFPVQRAAAGRAVAAEHYNRLARTLDKNVPACDRLNIKKRDAAEPDRVQRNSGAARTDAPTMRRCSARTSTRGTRAPARPTMRPGSAVMMEAVRILKTSGVRMRRTVRLALWIG